MITPLSNNNKTEILITKLQDSLNKQVYPFKLSKTRLYSKLLIKLLVALSILVSPVIFRYPYLPKAIVYSWFRDLGKLSLEYETRNLFELEGAHFIVRYQADDREIAPLVLETVEEAYGPVTKDFNFVPGDEKIPIIIYPTKEDLGRSFGWAANESAMGVYYSGAIRVLSPKEWVAARNEIIFKKTFRSSGPMAHEFTHLVVDYMTKGNYPRWLTEGLAQYEELKLTGFRFTEKDGTLKQTLYDLKDMDRNFDNLPNQSLAYRQSLAAVYYIINNYGKDKLDEILKNLAKGKSLNQSFKLILGVNLDKFNHDYKKWVKDNVHSLEK